MMGWKQLRPRRGKGHASNFRSGFDQRHAKLALPANQNRRRQQGFGVTNEGFRGIGVEQGNEYTFSVRARRVDGSPAALRVEVEDATGAILGETKVSGFTPVWKTYTASFAQRRPSGKARLNLLLEGRGTVDIDLVSLYPKETWKNRPNGLRADLVKLLKEMKPGFLRFPGGCIVEGQIWRQRYQWKTTIGDLDDRRSDRQSLEHRIQAPARRPITINRSVLAYYEYFLLSEDIGAEPLPILNCGMACQFNSAELAPLDDLDHYIQDAMDLIEFANAPANTNWGRKRAAMGHPAPFNLKMIGIGNEQWGPQYVERYEVFAKVLKAEVSEHRAGLQRRPIARRRALRLSVGQDARAEGRYRRRALLHGAEMVPRQCRAL